MNNKIRKLVRKTVRRHRRHAMMRRFSQEFQSMTDAMKLVAATATAVSTIRQLVNLSSEASCSASEEVNVTSVALEVFADTCERIAMQTQETATVALKSMRGVVRECVGPRRDREQLGHCHGDCDGHCCPKHNQGDAEDATEEDTTEEGTTEEDTTGEDAIGDFVNALGEATPKYEIPEHGLPSEVEHAVLSEDRGNIYNEAGRLGSASE